MMTIMQSWHEVKTRMQAAVASANGAAAEAAEIIRERCGQTTSVEVSGDGRTFAPQSPRWPGNSARLEYGCYRLYFTRDGLYRDGVGTGTRPVTEQHIPMSLQETEAVVEWLEALDTGTFISSWEAEQR